MTLFVFGRYSSKVTKMQSLEACYCSNMDYYCSLTMKEGTLSGCMKLMSDRE